MVILCGFFGATMLISGCSGAVSGSKPKYTIATDASWPPFEYVDGNTKKIVGFEIDLMNAIADKENLQVEFINVPWESLLAGISQCKFDAAVASIAVTENRKPNMLFSDPYYTLGQQIVVSIGNTGIRGKGDLNGKRVGVQISTQGASEVKKIGGAELVDFGTIELAFQALINGGVDAVVTDNIIALGYIGKYPKKLKTAGNPFPGESIAIAVCKTKTDLLQKINDGLAKVKTENLLDILNTKWVKNQKLN
jgi:polar amino acid transport system substrate-binding protein